MSVSASLGKVLTIRFNDVLVPVEALLLGTLEGGVATYDLAAGGVDIAPSQDLIAPEVITAVDEVKEKTIRIADIPAGSKVTVTEVYTGAGYEIVGDSKKVLESLVADEDSQEIATASFENKASNEIHGGYGIVNNYKYSKEDQDYTVKQSKENKTVQE